MSTDVSDAMQDLIRLRQLHEIVSLDYRRGLRAVANSGVSQREIAQRLRVTQPTISAVLRKAQDLPPRSPRDSRAQDPQRSASVMQQA